MLAAFLLMYVSTEIVGLTQRGYLLVTLTWFLVASGWFARTYKPVRRAEEPGAGVTSTSGTAAVRR